MPFLLIIIIAPQERHPLEPVHLAMLRLMKNPGLAA
jgi:hypothetical protein